MHPENSPGERESRTQTADRLLRLAADLTQIAEGHPPLLADLADAPVLDRYFVSERKARCLVGVQSGHPTVVGPRIVTSEVYAMAARGGWARTLSRYYRLGRPLLMPFNA